jgi:hypothetical protein
LGKNNTNILQKSAMGLKMPLAGQFDFFIFSKRMYFVIPAKAGIQAKSIAKPGSGFPRSRE